jgi:hypothetical protein
MSEASQRWNRTNKERCAAAQRRWYARNPERGKAASKRWAQANPDKIAAQHRRTLERNRAAHNKRSAEWRRRNPEKAAEVARKWRESNRSKLTAKTVRRNMQKMRAMPAWLSDRERRHIDLIYRVAGDFGLHVDHVIPLQGATVCGLHVPWNLRVLAPHLNIRKANKHV